MRHHLQGTIGRVSKDAGVRAGLQQVLKEGQIRRVRVVRHARAAVQRRPSAPDVTLIDWNAALLHQELDTLQLRMHLCAVSRLVSRPV